MAGDDDDAHRPPEETEPDADGVCERQELIREEARTVIEHQIADLHEVDDVAARTVRISAVLIGGLLGIVSLSGPGGISLANGYLRWSGVYLVAATILGLLTFNVSDPLYGPGKAVLRSWMEIDSSAALRSDVNRRLADWIDDMEVLASIDGLFLDLTQLALSLGLLYAGLAFLTELPAHERGTLVRALHGWRDSALHAVPLLSLVLIAALLWGYSAWRF